MNNMIEALERIAAYPSNRSEEMSIETAREIARSALASQAQPPKGMNAHGLDARYFHGKLSLILRDIENYKPEEMYRELSRLANVLETLPAPTMSQFATKADYESAMQSKSQQTKIKPALKVVNGEICYQSTDDDQAYGMWCPVVYDTVHDFAEGTKFFAIPPAPEGGDK